MATVIPFRGIRYNQKKISNLSKVITPPFDVISKKEQEAFYESHPQNAIRLILGKARSTDTQDDNKHTRAANCFNQWLSDDILVRDKEPSLYLTSLEFPFEGKTLRRYGVIAMVKLEPFEKKIILPHERTFSKVRSERLELTKACNANFCPIFSLYSDENQMLDALKKSVAGKAPEMSFTDHLGHKHALWSIIDPSLHAHVSNAMKNKRIFIADGHHRYETSLNYKAWVSENTPGFTEDHPANYVLMYLCSMEDPGMVILPAHRMLKDVPDSDLSSFISKAEQWFDITSLPFTGDSREKARSELISTLKQKGSNGRPANVIGTFFRNNSEFYILSLKPGVMNRMFGDELSDCMIDIDVTVLTRLIFMEILGFDHARLDNKDLISYSSKAEEAIDGVSAGKCDITFVLNPTKMKQVREVAGKGLIMPRKATYFYPKVLTGKVMNILEP